MNSTLASSAQLLDDWCRNHPDDLHAKEAAIERYQAVFARENLPNLTREEFKGFLLGRNNRHWDGINRQSKIYRDMGQLKRTLTLLLDEDVPIADRLDQIRDPKGSYYIPGLGRAVLTAILLCAYPDHYGVYNSVSEEALTRLGQNPVKKNDSLGKRYAAFNEALRQIKNETGLSFHLLDTMFRLVPDNEAPAAIEDPTPATNGSHRFPAEEDLQSFLVHNWEQITLGATLDIHVDEDGDQCIQYRAGKAGEADILARDKVTNAWVVIELKNNKSSDAVVGQTLRYMGYVKEHLAGSNEQVRGVIVTTEASEKIRYAVRACPDLTHYTFSVTLDLHEQATTESANAAAG